MKIEGTCPFHLEKNITSVQRLCFDREVICECSPKEYIASRDDFVFTAMKRISTPRPRHLELSEFFSPCTSAKAVGPHLAPFCTVRFWKNKWQKYREDVNNFKRKPCFTVAWCPVEVYQATSKKLNKTLHHPSSNSKAVYKPSEPKGPHRPHGFYGFSCGEISNSSEDLQLSITFPFLSAALAAWTCFAPRLLQSSPWPLGAPRRQCPHRGEKSGKPFLFKHDFCKTKIILQLEVECTKNNIFLLDAAWLNEGRCPGGRPSVS